MRSSLFGLGMALALASSNCSKKSEGTPSEPAGGGDAAPVEDAAAADTATEDTATEDTSTEDTSPLPVAPNISEALDCGAGSAEGPGATHDLQRHEIDLGHFPDAICNDGSTAALYFRPYVGEQNRNRWVIQLKGGGYCGTGDECAARWCWCKSTGPNGCPYATMTTNFNMSNMVSSGPDAQGATGIMRRGDPSKVNPLGDYNHVRLVYCSSDVWSGTRRDVPMETVHPKTGAPVSYSIHFLGARILDADFATLRQDGVPGLVYTQETTPQTLPDLDDAAEVIVAGDSAGGIGVMRNLDRLTALLRGNNTTCATPGTCPLVVRGVMDASVGPERGRLDYDATVFGTYDGFLAYANDVVGANHGQRGDESCLEWHAAHAAGTEAVCSDDMHVIRHHITAPFFVRMALLDTLVSGNYIETAFADPVLGPMTLTNFALILQRELKEFPNLPATAEEGAAMTTAPGVFAPGCPKHDTLNTDEEVYGVTIDNGGGTAYHLFDVFEPWRSGGSPTAVLAESKTASTCPQ